MHRLMVMTAQSSLLSGRGGSTGGSQEREQPPKQCPQRKGFQTLVVVVAVLSTSWLKCENLVEGD